MASDTKKPKLRPIALTLHFDIAKDEEKAAYEILSNLKKGFLAQELKTPAMKVAKSFTSRAGRISAEKEQEPSPEPTGNETE